MHSKVKARGRCVGSSRCSAAHFCVCVWGVTLGSVEAACRTTPGMGSSALPLISALGSSEERLRSRNQTQPSRPQPGEGARLDGALRHSAHHTKRDVLAVPVSSPPPDARAYRGYKPGSLGRGCLCGPCKRRFGQQRSRERALLYCRRRMLCTAASPMVPGTVSTVFFWC